MKLKTRSKISSKIWLFLSKRYYSYIIIAIILSVILAMIAYENNNLEVKDVIELSAFSAVVLESILRGITESIRKLAANKVEDPSKLTTDYENIIKMYHSSQSDMIMGSESSLIPVIREAWLYDKEVVINDQSDFEYKLPELVVRYYDQLFSAHDTSNIYNNINIRVNNWALSKNCFVISTGRTTYYSSLVTNRAMDYEIEKGITVRQLYECGSFIHSISHSVLSNHIGFNGFVESSDGYFAFIYREKNVSIGKETWATSIGASLKAKYALDAQHLFAIEGLENGILCEINKELMVKKEHLEKIGTQFQRFVLIAAYRDLVEGGKPQLLFYAKSKLSKKRISNQFKKRSIEIAKKTKKTKDIRDKKEIEMEIDGRKIKWIPRNDVINVLKVYSDRIVYNGVEMAMLPSATASIQMLKEYLTFKDMEELSFDNC